MLSFSSKRLLNLYNPRCLPTLNTMINKRDLTKGVVRTIRDKLPKYKKNIGKLPPLTALLVQQNNIEKLKDAIDMKKRKLQVYKEYVPIGMNTNYLEALFNENINDVNQVLNIIDENLITLNSFHIAVSFEALDDLVVARLCDPMTIAVAPEFERLCRKTISKLRFFEADEVLKLLKCLSNLNIPEDTLIVQTAFQMTRHHINDFNYEELKLLASVLETFEEKIESKKSLLIALKNILPKAKERQIKENHYTNIDEANKHKAIDK